MSSRAAPATRTSYSGRCFFAKATHEVGGLLAGAERGVVAAIDIVNAFLDGTAQPFQLGFIFLLQKSEPLASYFAGVAEAARSGVGFIGVHRR